MSVSNTSLATTPEGWDKIAPLLSDVIKIFGGGKHTNPGAVALFDRVIPDVSKLPKNVKVLDVAAGTGALALHTAQKIQDINGTVLATDFSPAMIAALKANVTNLNLPNVEAEVMDGQNLTIPDDTFDYVFSVWGLLFFPDVGKGLSEMRRVIKSGGKAAIATWNDKNFLCEVTQIMAKRLNREYSPPHFLSLSTEDAIRHHMSKAGLKDIVVCEKDIEFNLPTHEMYIQMMRNNPATLDIRKDLGVVDQQTYEHLLLEVIKEKYPVVPAKIIQVSLLAYGTK